MWYLVVLYLLISVCSVVIFKAWWEKNKLGAYILGDVGLFANPLFKFDTLPELEESWPPGKLSMVVSHWKEDVTWLKHVRNLNIRVHLYEKPKNQKEEEEFQKNPSEYKVPFNRGDESSVYFKYIQDNYNNLPEYIIFCHAHEFDYHHTTSMIITCLLDLPSICDAHEGFVSLNHDIFGNTCKTYRNRLMPDEWDSESVRQVVNEVYGEDASKPPFSTSKMCSFPAFAQFVVNRAAVHARPLEFYQRAYKFSIEPTIAACRGRVCNGYFYEQQWHFIFGVCWNFDDQLTQINYRNWKRKLLTCGESRDKAAKKLQTSIIYYYYGKIDGLGNRLEELIWIQHQCFQNDTRCQYVWNKNWHRPVQQTNPLLNFKNIDIVDTRHPDSKPFPFKNKRKYFIPKTTFDFKVLNCPRYDVVVHIRATDRLKDENPDDSNLIQLQSFIDRTANYLNSSQNIQTYAVVSDDNDMVTRLSNNVLKTRVSVNYDENSHIPKMWYDFYLLSHPIQCVIMCCKFSSFSVTASIVGEKKLMVFPETLRSFTFKNYYANYEVIEQKYSV